MIMKKRSWKYYFGWAMTVHVIIFGLLALAGIQWMQGEQEDKKAIEVSFVAENTAAAMAGGSSAGGGDNTPDIGPAIKTASVAAVEMLQSLRGHNTDTTVTAQQPISDGTTEAAIEQVAAALEAPAGSAAGDLSNWTAGVYGPGGGKAGGKGNGGLGNGTGGSGTGTATGLGPGFSPNGDGTYTASSAAGISYQLLRDAEAVYPDEARSIGYGDVVEVVARIMVGLDGSVESVTILSNPPKLGFREAANEALYAMRFAPIYYQGVNIRVPFEKHLIFQP